MAYFGMRMRSSGHYVFLLGLIIQIVLNFLYSWYSFVLILTAVRRQVARFSAGDSRYRQAVLLRDVPWAIPLQDLSCAFAQQGIATGSIERLRQYVRVEVR